MAAASSPKKNAAEAAAAAFAPAGVSLLVSSFAIAAGLYRARRLP
jgi:hypothetical protein